MSPLDAEDMKEYYGATGEFTSVKKLLKPGESKLVNLLDLARNYKTKFPIAGKEYGYRLTLEIEGKRMLMDMNGKDTIKQAVAALYPHGPTGELVPCQVTLTRRTERKTYEGELIIAAAPPNGEETVAY